MILNHFDVLTSKINFQKQKKILFKSKKHFEKQSLSQNQTRSWCICLIANQVVICDNDSIHAKIVRVFFIFDNY